MAKLNLSIQNLGEVDGGRAGGIIDAAIKAAVADLDDRGKDGLPRKVTITLSMKQSDESNLIFTSVKAKATLPEYATSSTVAEFKQLPHGEGLALAFQPLSPHDPDQEPLPKMQERRGSQI